ncbi:helix-turn-helix domain-containing protein [Pseudonocardia humida]|uniref:Helix-turn-helix domain-containing protein n=1 Tax=Pseudonocardia humida TaxID=2800819 RepID=A0ABT1A4A8_9PSEU|nr:helix-turn-helix domain-containing protein [Pseudonocardia humida]MCO1657836.1 helix-turn-helix domain-containing protein [Pseudonocardia humida]
MGTPLSAAIRRLRGDRGLSQRQVAEAVGVERPTVTQWESGRFTPAADTLRRLDEALRADGELVRLAGPGDVDRVAPARASVGEPSGATLAQVFAAVGDRLVGAVVRDPDDDECVGWAQGIGSRRRRPSPWSTALAVRTLLLLDRVDIDMRSIARTMGRRQHAGGWSNRVLDRPRPDVTAVVLGTLTRVGRAESADLEAAWTWLSTSMDDEDRHRTFVLSTVLENLAQLRPRHPFVGELVRLLLDARMDVGGRLVWAAYSAVAQARVEPSVTHTARAVVALRTLTALVDHPEVEDAVGQAVEWLASERNDDGVTEILRVDPEQSTLDVPVDHFTSAHVIRALIGRAGVSRSRLEGAFGTLWSSYVPEEGVWAWKQDGRLPVWMSHDAVLALRGAALAGYPVPHAPQTGALS